MDIIPDAATADEDQETPMAADHTVVDHTDAAEVMADTKGEADTVNHVTREAAVEPTTMADAISKE